MIKHAKAIRKIPGGKLVRVDVDYSPARVEHVKVTGDFFLTPDDLIEPIEACLAGASIPLDEEGLALGLQNLLHQHQAVLIGFSPADLVDILREAIQ